MVDPSENHDFLAQIFGLGCVVSWNICTNPCVFNGETLYFLLIFDCFVSTQESSLSILQVVLPSGESVVKIQPVFDTIRKCPGMEIIVSGAAPSGSGFDFYSRFFCLKLGINEVNYVSLWSQPIAMFVKCMMLKLNIYCISLLC